MGRAERESAGLAAAGSRYAVFVSDPWSIAGVVWLAAATLAVGLALFRDRSRGRRRCGRCWYDLAGTPGLTCPECGRVHANERAMHRTRRRWRRAFLALAIGVLASQACFATPRVRARGWPGLIPTSALMVGAVWVSPWESFPDSDDDAESAGKKAFRTELLERLSSSATWCWQKAVFQRLCAAWAAPAAARDQRGAGSRALEWLYKSQESGFFSPWAFRPYLDAVAPGLVRCRTKWVTGRPLRIEALSVWLPGVPSGRLALEVSEAGRALGASTDLERVELEPLAAGVHDLEVTIRLREGGAAGLLHPEGVWSTVRRFRVEVFPTLEGWMKRWSDAEMRAALVESMALEAVYADEVNLRLSLSEAPWQRSPLGLHADLAPCMNVVLETAGPEAALRWAFPWPRGSSEDGTRAWLRIDDVWRSAMRTGMSVERYGAQRFNIRVVGDPDESLAREDSTSFWEGELRFTLEARMGVMHLVPAAEGAPVEPPRGRDGP